MIKINVSHMNELITFVIFEVGRYKFTLELLYCHYESFRSNALPLRRFDAESSNKDGVEVTQSQWLRRYEECLQQLHISNSQNKYAICFWKLVEQLVIEERWNAT